VRRVVREIEKERPRRRGLLGEIVTRPTREEIRRMAFGRYLLRVAPHVVAAMAQMRGVTVHHVAEKTVKKLETALARQIG